MSFQQYYFFLLLSLSLSRILPYILPHIYTQFYFFFLFSSAPALKRWSIDVECSLNRKGQTVNTRSHYPLYQSKWGEAQTEFGVNETECYIHISMCNRVRWRDSSGSEWWIFPPGHDDGATEKSINRSSHVESLTMPWINRLDIVNSLSFLLSYLQNLL